MPIPPHTTVLPEMEDSHRSRWETSVDQRLNDQGQRLTIVEGDLRRVDATTTRIERDNRENFGEIKRSLGELQVKSSSYGNISAKSVVVISISVLGLAASIFFGSITVTLGLVTTIGRMALNPINTKIDEEVLDRKKTDDTNVIQGEKISALGKQYEGLAERLTAIGDRISENKEWLLEKSDDTRLLLEAMNFEYLFSKQASRDEALLLLLKEIANGKEESH